VIATASFFRSEQQRDAVLVAGLPLLLLAANFLYVFFDLQMPGRAAELVLGLGAMVGIWSLAERAPRWPGENRDPRRWAPWWWCLGALGWCLIATAWSPTPRSAVPFLGERAAALIVAATVAGWWARRPPLIGLTVAGAGILALAVIGEIPIGERSLTRRLDVGREVPFGLNNFNLAAMPLLAIGAVLLAERALPQQRRVLAVAVAIGLVALVCIGAGLGGVLHATTAAWLGLGGIAFAVAAWRFFPAKAACLLGGALALALVVQLGLSLFPSSPVEVPPSVVYRLGTWGASAEAFADAPLLGHGPGAAPSVLPAQPSYAVAWLAVPSFPYHAHSEFWQVLLDGGPLLALLLLAGLAATLHPLLKRRDEPVCRALLAAWFVFLLHALVESHLSQPGPLLCLGLLAGSSWALVCRPHPVTRTPALAMVGAPLALLSVAVILAVILDTAQGGGPADLAYEQARRRLVRIQQRPFLASGERAAAMREEFAGLRPRVGSADVLAHHRGEAAILAGAHGEAVEEFLAQGERLPVYPPNLRRVAEIATHHEDLKIRRRALAILTRARDLLADPLLDRVDWGARGDPRPELLEILAEAP